MLGKQIRIRPMSTLVNQRNMGRRHCLRADDTAFGWRMLFKGSLSLSAAIADPVDDAVH
jgi:hypothetical protein